MNDPFEDKIPDNHPILLSEKEHSYSWAYLNRIIHWFFHSLASAQFLIGSVFLFPMLHGKFSDALSAWLYTIGSSFYLAADVFEWLVNCRAVVKSCRQSNDGVFIEDQVESHSTENNTGKLRSVVKALSFFFSILGSLLYMFGSLAFVPEINARRIGFSLFAVGSAVIMTSQGWKVCCGGLTFDSKTKFFKIKLTNKLTNKKSFTGVFTDLFALLGACSYFVGCVVFLCKVRYAALVGAILFTIGAVLFAFSVIGMFVQYFLIGSYPREESRG